MKLEEKPLVNLSICPCGYRVLHDAIPLGTMYRLSEEVRGGWTYRCGGCGRVQRDVVVVMAQQRIGFGFGWLPYRLFVGFPGIPDMKEENELRLKSTGTDNSGVPDSEKSGKEQN